MKTYLLHSLTGRRPGLAPATPLARGITPAPPRPALPRGDWKFAPLSKPQKAVLCRLAGLAYQEEIRRGRITVSKNLLKSKQLEDWRCEQQLAACGVASLCAATQQHYRALRAHFNNLLGTPAGAARSFRDNMRTGPVTDSAPGDDTHEARELWRHNLNKAIAAHSADGVTTAYMENICKSQFNRPLAAATPYQLKCLTNTAWSRGRSKRAKAKGREVMDEHDNQPF